MTILFFITFLFDEAAGTDLASFKNYLYLAGFFAMGDSVFKACSGMTHKGDEHSFLRGEQESPT